MGVNLEKMNVAELKELAGQLGIEGCRIMKRAELVEAIGAVQGETPENVEVTTFAGINTQVTKSTQSGATGEPAPKKKLMNDDEIEVMNNTTGRYGYRGRSGFSMEMTEYGDIIEVPLGELKRMRAEQKRHIEDAFIVILDEDAVKELRFEKLYQNIFDKEGVEYLLQTPDKLAEVLPKMPKTMRETVGAIAIKKIKNREITNILVKDAIEKSLGIKIDE